MIKSLLVKVFKTRNERVLKKYESVLNNINNLEAEVSKYSDQQIKEKSLELKELIQNKQKTLDAITPMAFALCREASKRVLGMRHFDVQILGGLTLTDGKIAEMRTGEGKTLVATLSAYLNSLSGNSVHVFTVNDYLAHRDYTNNAPLFDALGVSSGFIYSDQDTDEKHIVYKKDIIYGTNSEFGFDYLRNNLVYSKNQLLNFKFNYAIVDEVDSILIDEARTPLIISGQSNDVSLDMYEYCNRLAMVLRRKEDTDSELDTADFIVDEEKRDVHITEDGYTKIENLLVQSGVIHNHHDMYTLEGIRILNLLNNSLKARHLYHAEQHYIVKNDEIIIVDEFTGRLAEGRRWGDGLHQAVEAKESVTIQPENKTIATITYQNFFKLYNKLSGMTGTAGTEATEFHSTYNLEVVTLPTNKPIARKDNPDQIYFDFSHKMKAVIEDIKDANTRRQPVLVGTASIESSEIVSNYLKSIGIEHTILNAKYHEQEAEIIAQAGVPGAVTIATNMAGRGTDIILGGNISAKKKDILENELIPIEAKQIEINMLEAEWRKLNAEAIHAGGLRVIGVEKNEARRIDNQLRGRAGRQGDPGSSIFYLSLDDNLFRIFGGDRVKDLVSRLGGMSKDDILEGSMITKVLTNAQIKLENNNFEQRKQLKEYDNILSEQREIVYKLRMELLEDEDYEPYVLNAIDAVTNDSINRHLIYNDVAEEVVDFDKVWLELGWYSRLQKDMIQAEVDKLEGNKEEVISFMKDILIAEYIEYKPLLQQFAQNVILQTFDSNWQAHLTSMTELQNLVHLRAFAQKDPKQEFKKDAFASYSKIIPTVTLEFGHVLLSAFDSINNQRKQQEDLAAKQALYEQQQTSLSDKIIET